MPDKIDISKQSVKGFKAAAVAAGLKKGGAPDMALIVSEKEASAAGVFTTNKVKAAPVLLTRKHMKGGRARAIIANAGCANACTGDPGLADAHRTADLVGEALGIQPQRVLVASTGVIGQRLNMGKVEAAILNLKEALTPKGIPLAAEAIMTTDSFSKISSFDGPAENRSYRIAGIAKGAGMIMPNMATMLCFILSDIQIAPDALQEMLSAAAEKTFNRISVDGDTSTNDMVLMMANGMAGNTALGREDQKLFEEGLTGVMENLARMIVKDGEGATKLVDVIINNAASADDALKAARTVANSSLVKTAFYGQDPNWGRIMAALGRADIEMHESQIDIRIDDVQIVSGGLACGMDAEKRAAQIMTRDEFVLSVDLHQGNFRDHVVTSDLTHEYIDINADYRT
ncbi:MAG: bifunctional glutamate N-acetyltransferase/amino-acid acetyltransferase ArgJ [Deltaproteobacteria bacterium]|nr:bifunctional glutamate N-acetyltransferase/amino-acid acetyltransferase ArgJ [Deltaproteobacteria bacterium]